jgi:hypothetical protein
MKSLSELSVSDLQRVIAIKQQLERLEAELGELTGQASAANGTPADEAAPGKRKLSPAHRRKLIKALARARKVRWGKAKARAAAPKKRRMSAAGRAAVSAAAKARWARFHAQKRA